MGTCSFYIAGKFRKRTLSNLALANELSLSCEELILLAKQSFQNLMTTLLEFGKISREKNLSRLVTAVNPEKAQDLLEKRQGIIFFCGHQANWELLFLDGIWRFHDGVAVARPIKNPVLYRWIKSVREKFGGKIVPQQQALKEGLKALKAGKFLGIVGDQGMPESPFSSKFLGRTAWTSSAPALLSFKTGCPIIVATIKRKKHHYFIHYSDPVFPNLQQPMAEETERLMNISLSYFAQSIKECPGQWLWQHNRWKQETPNFLYYRFRQDSVLVVLPRESESFEKFSSVAGLLRDIYPKAFLSLMIPKDYRDRFSPRDFEILTYENDQELFFTDYRFKIVFNFTDIIRLRRHFFKQSALEVLTFSDLYQIALDHKHIEKETKYPVLEIIKRALCRPGTFWT
ncbi:MAG: lipid A biosynthesis lauroyl acyltransferase [Simkaniaceae bacterium]